MSRTGALMIGAGEYTTGYACRASTRGARRCATRGDDARDDWMTRVSELTKSRELMTKQLRVDVCGCGAG